MAQNVKQYCHVCKSQTMSGSPLDVFLQSFVNSAQLSACHLLRFVYEISAQFCHNFTTILPLNHFVHHERSQLFVAILVQNTELSRLNHGKHSVGYHDFVRSAQLSACQLLRFVYEISAQLCHNFTTILPLYHFVHHERSQLFVTILVQNTELSRLNHGKYSVGYHDLSVCL